MNSDSMWMRASNLRWMCMTVLVGGCCAGCDVPGNVPSVVDPMPRPAFAEPSIVTDLNYREPRIAVADDNTIYVASSTAAANSEGGAADVFRSDDGGRSWIQTPRGLRGILPGGGNMDIAVEPETGKVVLADLYDVNTTVSISEDRGNTWRSNPLQGLLVQHRPWISIPAKGRIYLATHNYGVGIELTRSSDGLHYRHISLAITPADQEGCPCAAGYLITEAGDDASGSEDKVGLIYPTTTTGRVKFARSDNGGATFEQIVISEVPGADVQHDLQVVRNAGAGHLVAAWLERFDGKSRAASSFSEDWGKTWSPVQYIRSGGTSMRPWLDVYGSRVGIMLTHSQFEGVPDAAPEDASWQIEYLESNDGGRSFGRPEIADPESIKLGPICTEAFACYATGDFVQIPPNPPMFPREFDHIPYPCDLGYVTGLVDCSLDRELGNEISMAFDRNGKSLLAYTKSIDGHSDTQIRVLRQN